MRRTVIAALLAFGVTAAHADEHSGFTLGIGAGQAKGEIDEAGIQLDGHALALKAFAGWRFNPYIAIEIGYVNTQELKDTVAGVLVGIESKLLEGSAMLSWPINQTVGVYARGGLAAWESDIRVTDGITTINADDDGSDPFYGIGLSAILDGAQFRLEYQRADLGDVESTEISLSIAWLF